MDSGTLNQLDWVILAVLAASSIRVVWRGVVKEVFSVAGWIAGFIFAFRHAADVGQVLPITSFGPVGRTAAGAVIVILVTLAAFAVFGSLLRLVIKAVSGGVGDGALGFIFGFIRGAVIVMAGVFVASFTSSPESRMWQQSELIPYAEKGLVMCLPLMPDTLVQIADIAKKQQDSAKALWNAKYRLEDHAGSLK